MLLVYDDLPILLTCVIVVLLLGVQVPVVYTNFFFFFIGKLYTSSVHSFALLLVKIMMGND